MRTTQAYRSITYRSIILVLIVFAQLGSGDGLQAWSQLETIVVEAPCTRQSVSHFWERFPNAFTGKGVHVWLLKS
jgi:hypothetical protein